VEENRRDLTKNAVAYLNMDGVAGQYFGASAVPSMKDLIYSVTREVTEPRTGTSIYEDWKERSGGKLPTIGQLGSGSDYTAFLQHVGVPSADTGFSSGEGLYHSAYDNSETIERFIDPGYVHHATSARVNGIMALRLANADVLPFRYSDYAEEVVQLLKELEEQGTGVDLSTLIGQAEQWKNAAVLLEEQAHGMLSDGVTPKERRQLQKINSALLKQERDLTRPEGLPGRNWYKHQIWAPGLSTGYAAQPLPALAEAIENGDRKALLRAVHQLGKSLSEATRTAKRAVEQ
jgi:N-acetylated-alpha-linked acidic dipeptidase